MPIKQKMKTNVFYHGDCLFVMKHDIPDESIDLIYLDPPFFTGKVQKGEWKPGAMEISYEDSRKWWGDSEKVKNMRLKAPEWMSKDIAIEQPDFASYLYYMMERLNECHRILKSTGSIYLHCDWRASHYLKMVMDKIFRYKNFRNEIIWEYQPGSSSKKDFGRKHDTIFRYSKTDNYSFYIDSIREPYSKKTLDRLKYNGAREKNVNKVLERGGRVPIDVWYYSSLQGNATESCGYPTQKPEALLERIIKASSNEGDTVLDPFCGCGTTILVAHELNREWIGIDIGDDVFEVIRRRTMQSKLSKSLEFSIIERTLGEVKKIVIGNAKNKGQTFEKWVNEFYGAKKPKDKGVDGITPEGIPIQVKTFKINDTIVNGFYGQATMHPSVPKPLTTIRLVSGEGYNDNARQAKFEIESRKGITVELLTPEDMITQAEIDRR